MNRNFNCGQISILIFFIWLGHCWTAAMGQSGNSTETSTPVPLASFFSTTTTKSAETLVFNRLASPVELLEKSSNPRIPRNSNKNSERDLITIVGRLPKDKLNRYKMEAAKHVQVNLIRCFQALSHSSAVGKVPGNMRSAARKALVAAQAGSYNSAIVNNLPAILRLGSQQQGHPANQLQVILNTIVPDVPPGTQGQLQGLLAFLSSNLSGVNALLGSALGSVPDLLSGVIKSLTDNLGAVTGTLNGTLASLGILLGGALG